MYFNGIYELFVKDVRAKTFNPINALKSSRLVHTGPPDLVVKGSNKWVLRNDENFNNITHIVPFLRQKWDGKLHKK